jgi:alkanesulfonate monooxygenase SsuD/methylene tetrahydromethanopterin reductase-like flavin-dependent oxidoreductase (luciferase family)
VWIGGRARPVAARRLARYGAGWIPWGTTPETFTTEVAQIRELVGAEGGDPGLLQIAYPLVHAFLPSGGIDYGAMFADVPRLAEAGVTDFQTLQRVPQDHAAALAVLSGLRVRFTESGRPRSDEKAVELSERGRVSPGQPVVTAVSRPRCPGARP